MQQRIGHLARRPQPVDGTRQGELCRTETGDEVAASYMPAFLQHLQHRIRRRVPALHPFGQHRLAGDDTVSLEQLQGSRVGRLGGRRHRHSQRCNERPPTGARGWADSIETTWPRPAARCGRRARRLATRQHRPQRRQRIVGDLSGPHEVPQRCQQLDIGRVDGRSAQLIPEAGAVRTQVGANGVVQGPVGRLCRLQRGIDRGELIGEVQTDPAVARTDCTAADPDHIAGRTQLVEVWGAVAAQPRRQQLGLQRRGHQCRTLQLSQRLDQRIETTTFAGDAVPGLDEPGVRLRLDRFDLSAQHRQRTASELTQHVDIAILTPDATRSELAMDHAIGVLQSCQGTHDAFDRRHESASYLGRRERPMSARVSGDQ